MTTTKTKDWNESHSLAFRLCFCTDAFDAAACTLDIRRAHIFTVIFIHFNFFLLNFVSLVRFCLVCPSIYSSLLSLCQFKHYTIGSLCHLVFASQLFKWKWKQSKSCEKKSIYSVHSHVFLLLFLILVIASTMHEKDEILSFPSTYTLCDVSDILEFSTDPFWLFCSLPLSVSVRLVFSFVNSCKLFKNLSLVRCAFFYISITYPALHCPFAGVFVMSVYAFSNKYVTSCLSVHARGRESGGIEKKNLLSFSTVL